MHTTITSFPTISSGLYHLAIPDTICLVSEPNLTWETKSLSAFGCFSQDNILPTLNSTLSKSSIVISSLCCNGASVTSSSSSFFSANNSSSSATSLSMSNLWNNISPLVTFVPGFINPNVAVLSQFINSSPSIPIWA